MLPINFITSLEQQGFISATECNHLQEYIKKHKLTQMQAISQLGLMEKEDIVQAVAKRYCIEFISLRQLPVLEQESHSFSSEQLFELGVAPFEIQKSNNIIKVAVVDPTDTAVIEIIGAQTGMRVQSFLSLRSDINYYIEQLFAHKKDQSTHQESQENADVIFLVHSCLSHAVRCNASDIHIEGMGDKVRVRFRVDGVLQEHKTYPVGWIHSIMSRIKIISGMDIAERRIPQDGKFTEIIDRNEYDFRGSVIPTVAGEKCVLRIAPKRMVFTSKEQLGLGVDDLEKFHRIFSKQHGMVLVTGPTGCGKTTTLYSMLSELSTVENNTVTVEDPVEINLSGVNQVQVNTKAGMGFSNALRSILRQDPDIIMLGEIRDVETAKTAIQASVTGHLVLSTLHTNSAANTVNRLVNMGIEPYLVADALIGVISQRLLRTLCPHCKEEIEVTAQQAHILSCKEGSKIYKQVGCKRCNGSGYLGRTSVFEILEFDDVMRNMINQKEFNTQTLHNYGVNQGMKTLSQGAQNLVLSGLTTYEESLKIQVDKESL